MAANAWTRLGGSLALSGIALALGSVACAQSGDANSRTQIHFSQSYGAGLPQGQTTTVAGAGFAIVSGLSFAGTGRWSFPIDLYGLFSNLPGAVLDQAGIDNGVTALVGVTEDPIFTLAQGGRWGAYVSGGGGMSLKEVHISGNPCGILPCTVSNAEESSWQPMVDGGAGITYRVLRGRDFQIFAETRFVNLFTPSGQFPGFNTAGTRLLIPQLGYRF